MMVHQVRHNIRLDHHNIRRHRRNIRRHRHCIRPVRHNIRRRINTVPQDHNIRQRVQHTLRTCLYIRQAAPNIRRHRRPTLQRREIIHLHLRCTLRRLHPITVPQVQRIRPAVPRSRRATIKTVSQVYCESFS